MNDLNVYSNEEEMLLLLEEMQTETEQKDQTISRLKAYNRQLTELAENLNNEIRKENPKALRKELVESEVKRKKEMKARITAEQRMSRLQDKISFADDKTQFLESELLKLKRKCRIHKELGIGFMLYDLIVTVFMAFKNQVFLKDMTDAFIWIKNILIMLFECSYGIGKILAVRVSKTVTIPALNGIIYWIMRCVITGGIPITVLMLLFLICKWIVKKYMEYCVNLLSLAVMVISLSVCIFWGSELKKVVPVNLLLLIILIQMLYLGIRWYVSRCRQYRGY